jgi:hypothetical protein
MFESQLSWQRHYSFSVWSAMAVVKRMVDLRNQELNMITQTDRPKLPDEIGLLLHAINNCVLPALCACDIPTFERLVAEVSEATSTSICVCLRCL